MAMSGTFSGQHFQLIPGESVSTPDIYVVVFNNTDSDMQVGLIPETPAGVELVLSTSEFLLSSGSQQKVEVGVAVSDEAAPGEYALLLTAEACSEGEGIKLGVAAQQQAKLTVFGEAGSLVLSTVTPDGDPLPATLKVYRQAEGRGLPCAHSNTGKLKTRLVPGEYLAEAYFQENKVAGESFNVETNESKDITLVARTVLVEGFSVVPNYHTETNELAFAKIVYTINNLYQPLQGAKAILKMTLDDQAVEELELISLPTLDVGRTAGSSNYIPAAGWQDGTYSFSIELYNGGKLYTQSSPQEMAAGSGKGFNPVGSTIGGGLSWPIISGIAAAVAIALLVFWLRRGGLERGRR